MHLQLLLLHKLSTGFWRMPWITAFHLHRASAAEERARAMPNRLFIGAFAHVA